MTTGAETPDSVASDEALVEAEPASARPNARRAVTLLLRTSLLAQLLGVITGVELARGLGVHNRGALAAAMLWATLAGNVGTLGVEESTTYHVAREPGRVGAITGSALALCALQSVLFFGIAIAIIPVVLHARSHYVIVAAWIYALYVPLNMVSVTLNAVLNGLHRYASFNAVFIAIGLFILFAQTLLLVLGVMTVHTLVIAFVSMYLATALYAAAHVWRAGIGRLSVDRKTMRSLFSYGIRSHASTVPATLNFSLDQLVISVFLTTTKLGIYVIAVTMSTFTALIGAAAAKAILPNVASAAEGPERARLARRLISATMIMSAAVSLPVVVLAPWLIRLFFGPGYVAGAGVARILLVAAIALSTNRAMEAVLRGIGRPLDAGIAEFVALGATCVGLAVLIPLLGLTGAGVTSLFAYLVSMGYMTQRATKALGISPLALLTPDREAVVAIRTRLRGFARA